LKIAGLQKLTLIDYPGKVACTVFTKGCNLRCPYCHNPELIEPQGSENLMPEEDFLDFLKTRKNFLDGVCITGGEPALQTDLEDFVSKVKELGFLVKVDTNGTRPDVLSNLISGPLVDYVAMDIKTSLGKYSSDLGFKGSTARLTESIDMIMGSSLEHEFRTTVVPGLVEKEELQEIARMIKGSERYFIQNFRPGYVLDPRLSELKGYSQPVLEKFKTTMEDYIENVAIRN
jgi:pyruvate formate lyase activating enzyme